MDGDGAMTWLKTYAFPDDIREMAVVWRVSSAGEPGRVGTPPHPRFSDFYWLDGSLHALERSMGDELRLVRLESQLDRLEPACGHIISRSTQPGGWMNIQRCPSRSAAR